MHPASIQHLNVSYDLSHIPHSRTHKFSWSCRNNQTILFNVEVTYSTHCYSEEVKADTVLPAGSHTFPDRGGKRRVFCPIRYSHSLLLPGLVGKLFEKPTSQVMRTKEKPNWLFYELKMVPPLQSGQRYCVFFNLRQKPSDRNETSPFWLSMFIESAYARSQMVGTTQRLPFGRLAEDCLNFQKRP